MKGQYRIALSTLGTAALVAATLALLPTHRPATVMPVASTAATLRGPFRQVTVYRSPGGGLMRTETVRWQGPGSLTIVTWSSNTTAKAMPPWVGVELQNMMAQQQLLQTAMQSLMGGTAPFLTLAAPLGASPFAQQQVGWLKAPVAAPQHAPAIPLAPTHPHHATVDL